jgi:hypothetical protein
MGAAWGSASRDSAGFLLRRTMAPAATSIRPANALSKTYESIPADRRLPAKEPATPSAPKASPPVTRTLPARAWAAMPKSRPIRSSGWGRPRALGPGSPPPRLPVLLALMIAA